MPIQTFAKLIKKEEIKKDILKFSIEAEKIVKTAKPGNFIEVRVNNQIEPFLRRPISIYNMDKKDGILEFIFQIKGNGTKILSNKEVGDKIDILGPLGNGTFKFEKYNNIAIIGGGIGIFPLYELAKEAKEQKKNVKTYLGFRNKDLVMLEKEFKEVSDKLVITTDDGSYAQKGFAIDYLKKDTEKKIIEENSTEKNNLQQTQDKGKIKYKNLIENTCIYACGPLPMLKAVQKYAIENNINCQISLEEKMGCGLGVCLGCAVKKASNTKDNPEYYHVCKDGPVFNAKDVEI